MMFQIGQALHRPAAKKLAAILASCTALVGGCAAPQAPATRPAEPTDQVSPTRPQSGGYLHHTLPYSAQNIDPYTTEDPIGYGFIVGSWYEPVVQIDYQPGQDWRLEEKILPWLAESWQQPDDKTYLFRIRRGVKFHNGDSLDAHDVSFSFNRVRDPNLKINATVRQYLSTNLKEAEVVDDYTVRVSLVQPNPAMLTALAQRQIGILSKKFVEGGGDVTKEAVGTGPFILRRYQRDAEGLAVRNPQYWQQGKPYLDGIKMLLKVEDSTMGAAFVAGQTDLLMRNDRKQVDPILQANPKTKYTSFIGSSLYDIAFNLNRPPFNDQRVRKAIHLAIDRQAMVDAVTFGEGVAVPPLMEPVRQGWHIPTEELLKLPGYRRPKDQDLAEAKALLSQAGYASGFKTSILFPAGTALYPQLAEVFERQLKPLNIEVELQGVEGGIHNDRRNKGEWDLCMRCAGGGNPQTASSVAQSYYHSTGTFAKGAGMSDPEVDRLVDAHAQASDEKKRGEVLVALQRLLLENAYVAPLVMPRVYALWQPWIHDWVDNRSSRQTLMNPSAVWMDLSAAPADRRSQ